MNSCSGSSLIHSIPRTTHVIKKQVVHLLFWLSVPGVVSCVPPSRYGAPLSSSPLPLSPPLPLPLPLSNTLSVVVGSSPQNRATGPGQYHGVL